MCPEGPEGRSGYLTAAVVRIRTFSERERGTNMAQIRWANWLHNFCRLESPQLFRAGREDTNAHSSEG